MQAKSETDTWMDTIVAHGININERSFFFLQPIRIKNIQYECIIFQKKISRDRITFKTGKYNLFDRMLYGLTFNFLIEPNSISL